VAILAAVALYVLYIFLALLFVRLIVGWVMAFARDWRPTGIVAAVLELAFSATDPPLRALRRVIPPLRLGSFSLDLAFIVVLFVTYALIAVVAPHAA
jgi:YggT family protein